MVIGGRFITISLSVTFFAGTTLAQTPPVNDAFRNRIVLSGLTNNVQGSNVGASTEPGEPQHAGEGSTLSVWWTWTAPVTGSFALSTAGTTFDTLVGVYVGSTVSNLALVVNDDDSGSEGTSRAIFRAIAGEVYQIAVAGFLGASGSINLSLAPSGRPMPSWTLPSLEGNPVFSSNFPHNVLLLDFFETTCGDCILETADLVAYRHARQAQGFEILGFSKDYLTRSQIIENASQMGIDYTVLLNSTDVEAQFGGPLPMPSKILVDREGRIQMRITGGHNFAYYAALIDPLLRLNSRLQLQVRRQGDRAILSWPASEFGYLVEGSPDLSPASWQPVAAAIVENENAENTIDLPMSSSTAFFRLRHL